MRAVSKHLLIQSFISRHYFPHNEELELDANNRDGDTVPASFASSLSRAAATAVHKEPTRTRDPRRVLVPSMGQTSAPVSYDPQFSIRLETFERFLTGRTSLVGTLRAGSQNTE